MAADLAPYNRTKQRDRTFRRNAIVVAERFRLAHRPRAQCQRQSGVRLTKTVWRGPTGFGRDGLRAVAGDFRLTTTSNAQPSSG